MKPLAIHGYDVVAAAVLAQGSGTAATTLFVAAPAASTATAPHPVLVARWNHETGGWSERQAFHDPPAATDAAEGGARPAPALARAYAAYAERLAREASQLLAQGTPLSDLPGIRPVGHTHAMGLRAARRKSLDELGHAGWADTIVDAYLDPHQAWAALDAAGADYVEHEDELS
jgi:hypothetical protein